MRSSEIQEPFPLRRWRKWIRDFSGDKYLGKDPLLPSFLGTWIDGLDTGRHSSTGQAVICPDE